MTELQPVETEQPVVETLEAETLAEACECAGKPEKIEPSPELIAAAKEHKPKLSDFRYTGHGKFHLDDYPTTCNIDPAEEPVYRKWLKRNAKKLAKLQEKLFAEQQEGVIFMLQALDAAGKDTTIEHVFRGLNPGMMSNWSFKNPSKEELAHDYLWRAHVHLPQRGTIGIFNRSYYEDVLAVRVLKLWPTYKWPKRCYDMDEQEFFDMRFRQLRDYEQYLYESGYRLVKIYLNLSKDEQKNRFINRINKREKNWKFSAGDLDNRPLWHDYMEAFEDMIEKTATKNNPWYIIPADQKFVSRVLASDLLLEVLEDIDPKYPVVSEEDYAAMLDCRARLEAGEI